MPINFINQVSERIAERVIAYAHENWSNLIDEDGDISIDEDGLVHNELEKIMEYSEGLFEKIFNSPAVSSALDEVKIIVKDLADDAREWHMANQSSYAMLRYHGLSYREFI